MLPIDRIQKLNEEWVILDNIGRCLVMTACKHINNNTRREIIQVVSSISDNVDIDWIDRKDKGSVSSFKGGAIGRLKSPSKEDNFNQNQHIFPQFSWFSLYGPSKGKFWIRPRLILYKTGCHDVSLFGLKSLLIIGKWSKVIS